jgi:hypothetical protein
MYSITAKSPIEWLIFYLGGKYIMTKRYSYTILRSCCLVRKYICHADSSFASYTVFDTEYDNVQQWCTLLLGRAKSF